MTPREGARGALVAVALLVASTQASGQGVAGPASSAAGKAPTSASAAGSASGRAPAPDPHAGLANAPDGDDPHGGDPHGGDPHGGGGHAQQVGADLPQDSAEESPAIPPGTIDVVLQNENGEPLGSTLVTLGILHNTVAKGESRDKVVRATDAAGKIRFEHLETGSAVAYRVSTTREGGNFAVAPFRLGPGVGMRVTLHAYPVTSDVDRTLVVGQAVVFAELREDRIQVQQAFTIFNFGKTAWVPKDLLLALPEGYTALTSSQEMSDVVVEPVEKRGAIVRGTFGPGRHDFEMKWQLPYGGEKSATIDAPVPPHIAAARVIVPAAQAMTVDAEGFPKLQSRTDASGQRVLLSERQLSRESPPLKRIRIELSNLPTPGPARFLVTILAGGAIVLGVSILAFARSSAAEAGHGKERKERILTELEDLERAYRAGDVGPKTYERERSQLVDQLAELLAAAKA